MAGFGTFRNSYLYLRDADFSSKALDRFDKEQHNFFGHAEITLASFVQMSEKWAFGLINRSRNMATLKRIPRELAKFGYEGLDHPPLHNQRFEHSNFHAKGMAWGEIGIYAGRIIHQFGEQFVYAGASVKILNGFGYAGINFDNIDYVADSLNLEVNNFEGDFAFAVPGWGKGYGAGMDLGLTIVKTLQAAGHHIPHSIKGNCKSVDYLYKIGFSLLDVGIIRFYNSSTLRGVENEFLTWDGYSNQAVTGLSSFDFIATQKLEKSGADFYSDSTFNAWLPVSMSFQGDYNFENGFFASGVLMAPINLGQRHGAQRIFSAHASLRYEHRLFEVGVPLSAYMIRRPSIGLWLRLGVLEIGSGNFLPFLFNQSVYSGDVYAGLKFNILQSKECRQYRRSQKHLIHGVQIFRFRRIKPTSQQAK
jgi:hypothetical protein